MKILFISELYPATNRGGEFLRTNGLVKILSDPMFECYAFFGMEGTSHTADHSLKNVEYFNFEEYHDSGRFIKAIVTFKRSTQFISRLEKVLSKFNPDIVFIDYHYCGQYISYFRKKGLPVIYGTHNIQSNLTLQMPTNNLKDKIAHYLIYKIYRYHEKHYFKNADALIAVSNQDASYYQKILEPKKVFCITNFVDACDYKIPELDKENYIIMPANYLAYQNKAGLKWFLEEVWDTQLSNTVKFVIIGRNAINYYQEISVNKDYKNVEVVGEVKDIKPYIAKARATIVPLLHGSGTRLKCIESMALGTQIISTSLGAEGIEHEGTILIADQPVEFRQKILDFVQSNFDYTKKAFEIFNLKYSLQGNFKNFMRIISYIKNQ